MRTESTMSKYTTTETTDSIICPDCPNCGDIYHPHWCDNESWSTPTQILLDHCETEEELRNLWVILERAGSVDSYGGAEWHHAVAQLRHNMGIRMEQS
jgi:uncharacterized OB-fold protein